MMGGQMAAHLGIHYVFLSTSALLFLNAIWVYYNGKIISGQTIIIDGGWLAS